MFSRLGEVRTVLRDHSTKRVILEMYDQMVALGVHEDADRVTSFESWLRPGPASPSVAHPPRE
jgi:hypothetical protein